MIFMNTYRKYDKIFISVWFPKRTDTQDEWVQEAG